MSFRVDHRPIIFGEVLFDVFPGGNAVLGGAPFNVAWNLKGFGLDPLFISAVGRDKRGEMVLDEMEGWGLDTASVQINSEYPTGVVEITFTGGSHSFHILPEQAYDYIDTHIAGEAIASGTFSLLYHGSLAARSPSSRTALDNIRSSSRLPRFVDVNLREPWYVVEKVKGDVKGTDWVKLNSDELGTLAGADADSDEELRVMAEDFRRELGIGILVVTLGERGAISVFQNATTFFEPVHVEDIADTVGVGDAFSSVVILGLVLGWPLDLTIERAIRFAAELCTVRGAVTTDVDMYKEFAGMWGL